MGNCKGNAVGVGAGIALVDGIEMMDDDVGVILKRQLHI